MRVKSRCNAQSWWDYKWIEKKKPERKEKEERKQEEEGRNRKEEGSDTRKGIIMKTT